MRVKKKVRDKWTKLYLYKYLKMEVITRSTRSKQFTIARFMSKNYILFIY